MKWKHNLEMEAEGDGGWDKDAELEVEGYGDVVNQRDQFNCKAKVWDYMYRLEEFGSVSQVINYSRLFRMEESSPM